MLSMLHSNPNELLKWLILGSTILYKLSRFVDPNPAQFFCLPKPVPEAITHKRRSGFEMRNFWQNKMAVDLHYITTSSSRDVCTVDHDGASFSRATKYHRWPFCWETVNGWGTKRLVALALDTFVAHPLMVKGRECPQSIFCMACIANQRGTHLTHLQWG